MESPSRKYRAYREFVEGRRFDKRGAAWRAAYAASGALCAWFVAHVYVVTYGSWPETGFLTFLSDINSWVSASPVALMVIGWALNSWVKLKRRKEDPQ